MKDNRTSEDFAAFSTKCIMQHVLPGIPLVHQKYKRMEQALLAAAESGMLGDSLAGNLVKDALIFDPVSNE